ncbi:MAG: spore coat U domain-containing protein [Pseudomonadota bacterium]|nr:spore coat U domain-containing protein [Pseudomonadota bacterium]
MSTRFHTALRMALVAVLGSAAWASQAATTTANFQVKMAVNKTCKVTAGAASDIDFGAQDAGATGLSQSSTITVRCTKTTPYTVGLLPGNTNTGGAGDMVNGEDKVPYQLRKTSATGAAWGNVSGNWLSGTGNGTDQSLTVWATVAEVPYVAPGSYVDTVTVTVTY